MFLFADIVFFTSAFLEKQNTTYMCIKAVVSQQSNKVDDLVDVLVVVRFVRDEDPPCVQERGINTGGRESIINDLQTCWANTYSAPKRAACCTEGSSVSTPDCGRCVESKVNFRHGTCST